MQNSRLVIAAANLVILGAGEAWAVDPCSVETSSNLRDWSLLQSAVGNGEVFVTNLPAAEPHRLFRLNLQTWN